MSADDPKPNLTAALDHIEAAIVAAQTAQACEETNPVDTIRLESRIHGWRDDRVILIDILDRRT